MKSLLPLLLFLLTFAWLVAAGYAEELMFFTDDHYKAAGEPQLKASAVNPVLDAGANSTLRITLANVGLIQELIPNQPGDKSEISAEAKEELHSIDAGNITARLSGNGPVVVTSGPFGLASLPMGGVALLDFNITTREGAEGWYSLVLDLEYEHQIDARVINGSSSSLYRPSSRSQKISILVKGPDRTLKVEGVETDLHPGANGTILAVIKNNGPNVARNCTAKLMAVPPFRSASERYALGDISPEQAAVARLSAAVDGDAVVREYRLACEIDHDNQTTMVSLPVLLEKSPGFFPSNLMVPALFLSLFVGIALLWLRKGPGRSYKRRKRWPLK